MQYIKIHSQDNVAVALADIAAGSVVTIDKDSVTLGQDIVRGHWPCAGGYRAGRACSCAQYAHQSQRP